jgi:1,6-anhydro-N-acetylmuramate kinase
MSIQLALVDAANNCKQEDAKATLTLRSGVQITGRLKRDMVPDTAQILLAGGGWETVLIEEIAAVRSHR